MQVYLFKLKNNKINDEIYVGIGVIWYSLPYLIPLSICFCNIGIILVIIDCSFWVTPEIWYTSSTPSF